MRGREFLDVAMSLASKTGEEWHRTRIGRLYYGVYLEYRHFAEHRLGFNRMNLAREHRVISDLLTTLDASAAEDLRLLRIYRNQADYDLEIPPDEILRILSFSESLASSLMTRLERLRESHESDPPL